MRSHTLTANDGSKARFDIFSEKNGGHVQVVFFDKNGHNFYTKNLSLEAARLEWKKLSGGW
jgi:hypothetical protein